MWEEKFTQWTDSKPYGPMSIGIDFSFVGFSNVYGIPEHADSYSLKDTKGYSDPYRLFNTDVFEYELDSRMALYGSVPMMIAHSAKRTIGLLWLNPSETWVDIETNGNDKQTHWFSETGVIDVYVMVGETFEKVMEQNGKLTGTAFLPPIYAIGYHQSRWNYFSENEVMLIDEKFDDYNIPVDSIWLDVEYTEGRLKKYFTWDPINFADPQNLTSTLNAKGRRLITIIDPHLKKHVSYPIYKEAQHNHYLVKTKESADFTGWCWPGDSVWPDFINPSVQHWWSKLFTPKHWPGFDGGIVDIWNDMNEPSVFNGPEKSMQRDLVHYNGFEHRDVHNIYGYLMTKSTYEGLRAHRPNLRPFILTRSFFVGSQKHCAAWTGDNMSRWTHLRASIPMILSLSSVGISFSGADVPGFFHDPESENLVVRWYQAAAFQPFYRAHAHMDTKKREPWTFSDKTRDLISHAIRLRQNLLPYLYTLFYANHLNGMPPMRPLWSQFESEEKTFDIEDAFLLGKSILVHPVTEDEVDSIQVYLPGPQRTWLNLQSKTIYEGGKTHKLPVDLTTIPYFQLDSTIVARREKIRRSAALSNAMNDSIVLDVFLGKTGSADGDLYLDDGLTFNHEKGDYVHTQFTYQDGTLTKRVLGGERKTRVKIEKVHLYNYPSRPASVRSLVDGHNVPLAFSYDNETRELLIRRLDLNLAVDWKIAFK